MGWSIKEKENEGRLIELVVICPPPASLEMRWLRRENYSHKAIREIQNISQNCRALPDIVTCVLGLVFAVQVIYILLRDLVSLICRNKLTLMLINYFYILNDNKIIHL